MKIINVSEEKNEFDNGNTITFHHIEDWCELNYADFEQLDDIARATEFDEELTFQGIDNFGFRFGNGDNMFFVPCYSEQNGYYSSDVDILYNDRLVLGIDCEII